MSTVTRALLPAYAEPEFEQPGDEQLFFMLDRMHFPNPLMKLEDSMTREFIGGWNTTNERYDIPLRGHARRFFTYHYMAMAPLMLAPEQLEELGKRSEAKIGEAMAQLRERWDLGWLPEIREHLAIMEGADLQAAGLPQVLARMEDAVLRMTRLSELHFEIALPAYLAIGLFDELYCELFEGATSFQAYELLQGLSNKTVESGVALWQLSRGASITPEVRAIIERLPAEEVVAALNASPAGRAFQTDLDTYLDEFGRRGDMWGIGFRSWIEDPAPAIRNLRDYLAQPERDPERELNELAMAREARIAEARAALQSYPAPVREQFEFMLSAAQFGVILSEDHGYWIDFRSWYQVRRAFLEVGRRFAEAGVINAAEDIFHLSLEEIRETAARLPELKRQTLVATRKAEIAYYREVEVPPAIGTPPPGAPPDNPMTRTMAKFFGSPPAPSEDPDVINGAAGSPGTARGRAKVVRHLSEAGKLEQGDILVAETTAPPWTPLFATVAAVVTDTGGILSHCAVVAREYQIPAVVGCGIATSVIKDGDLLEVDGERGFVRIVR